MMSKTKKFYWLASLSWIGIIYCTLYIVRPVTTFLKANTPFELLTNIFIFLVLFGVIFFVVKNLTLKRKSTLLWLCVVMTAYIIGIFNLAYPEEKIHFLEYGLLAFLLFKALSFDFKKPFVYVIVIILTSVFGWIDEVIQFYLPNRYFQWEDIQLNAISALLGLFLVFIFEREKKYE